VLLLCRSCSRSSDAKGSCDGDVTPDVTELDLPELSPLIDSFASKATQLLLNEARHSLLPALLKNFPNRQEHKLQQLDEDRREALLRVGDSACTTSACSTRMFMLLTPGCLCLINCQIFMH